MISNACYNVTVFTFSVIDVTGVEILNIK